MGAIEKPISECAKAEMSERVKKTVHCVLVPGTWYSEPYHENQNFFENRYATIKASTNCILYQSGDPLGAWLLALTYIGLLLNHVASATLGWKKSMQVVTFQLPYISNKFLHFSFY
jgi:hypothetical protein